MAGFTNQTEADILNGLFTDPAWTPPTTLYLAAGTGTPTETGLQTEVSTSGTAYARQPTTAADWSPATLADPSEKTNTAIFTWPAATANYGTVTEWGVYSAVTAGTALIAAPLDAPKLIETSDILRFPAGALRFLLGDPSDSFV